MRRFVRIATILAVVAAVAVPTALALGFEPYNPKLPDATQGVPYSFQVTARGECGPPSYVFTVVSGSLPPGITLSTSGTLAGTATQSGTWGFYLQVVSPSCNPDNKAQRPFSLTVIPKLTVTTASPLASGVVGVPYSAQLTYEGGGTVTWSLASGTLPAGLTLSSSGLLAGTPTAVGATSFTVGVKDTGGSRSDTKVLALEILAPLTASVRTAPASEVDVAFKGITPAAAGGKPPYAWSVAGGSLPAGLSLDPASGAITGTPTAAGSFPLKLAVTDSNKTTATIDLPLTVAAKLSIVTLRLPTNKRVGLPYQATVRTRGGVSPTKWKVTSGRFPVGIRLDTKTGVLAGKPTKSGVFTITVTVTDRLGGTAEQSYSFTIKPKPKIKTK